MCLAGQSRSTQIKPNNVPKTLAVPFVLCIFAFLVFFLFYYNHNMMKITIIYPKAKSHTVACGLPVRNDSMTKVGDLKTYVIGSYLEHRFSVKRIHTVAIVLRSENAVYDCFFCCNGKNISASATCEIHSDHFGFEYGTGDITCQIPSTCTSPMCVAVTSQSRDGKNNLHNIQSFRTVRNLQTHDTFPYKFTVCISVMYNYTNVLGLIQALEMYKILGVQRVVVYKTNAPLKTQKVLDYYVKQGFVEIIPWPVMSHINVSKGWQKNISPGELHYFGQIPALNDCVYRYMYQSKYLALQDIDEYILPVNLTTWTELLPKLEAIHGTSVGFEFEENFFPISMKDSNPKFEPSSWNEVYGENILQYIKRIANDPREFNNFKVIVNPRLVYRTSVHGFLNSLAGSVRVDRNIARMYHLRKAKSRESLKRTILLDTHLRDYADRLIPAVSYVLRKALNVQ